MKVFLSDIEGLLDQSTIAELLDLSKQPKHLLYAYREIRQEVAFLSTLEHANLTQLCGVRTNPYMCLLLELAPKKSLRAMLKEYRDADVVLEPLTLKNTTMQVCAILVPYVFYELHVDWEPLFYLSLGRSYLLYACMHIMQLSLLAPPSQFGRRWDVIEDLNHAHYAAITVGPTLPVW